MLLSIFYEFMLKGLLGRPSLFWILNQYFRYEVSECRRPLGIFKSRWVFLHNLQQNFGLRFAMVRRLAICELNREDPETPNVYLAVIGSLSLDQFGSHPIDGTYFGFSGFLFFSELSGVTEIAQLNVTLRVN